MPKPSLHADLTSSACGRNFLTRRALLTPNGKTAEEQASLASKNERSAEHGCKDSRRTAEMNPRSRSVARKQKPGAKSKPAARDSPAAGTERGNEAATGGTGSRAARRGPCGKRRRRENEQENGAAEGPKTGWHTCSLALRLLSGKSVPSQDLGDEQKQNRVKPRLRSWAPDRMTSAACGRKRKRQ
jgi:hypothetical protein